jgi:hypothetical protein
MLSSSDMPDPTTIALEEQLDALAARLALVEWRQEQLVRSLTGVAEQLHGCGALADPLGSGKMVAKTAASQLRNERVTRVEALREHQREARAEHEREESLRDLARRVNRLEEPKR